MAITTTFNFMTLENLATYHGELTSWVNGQIGSATASSIKTVSISKDDTTGVSTMHFYTVDAPVGEAQAAFSIELPHDYYTEAEIDAKVQTINGEIARVEGKADAAHGAADTAQEAADAAQGAVDALAAKVGTVADGETVMGKIADNAGEIADLAAVVAALTGDEEGSVGSISEAIDAKIEGLDLPNTYEAKGAAAEEAGKVQDALEDYMESNDSAVAEAKKAGTDAQTYAEGVNTAFGEYKTTNDKALADEIARAKAAEEANKGLAEAAQDAVDALGAKVGEVPADKTVVQMIADAQTAATYDDTKVKEDIQANSDAIAAEKARMDAFMALGEGETLNAALDSLKELQDYITSEAAEADEIVAKVGKLEDIVAGIGGEGEEATVVAYVTKAIEALKIGDYAKVADLNGAVERIAKNEQAIAGLGDLAGKDIVTEAEVDEALMAKINASAEGNHSHSNKTVLDGITADKVSAWDNAQANAEAKAAELDAALKSELEGKINGVDAKFANYSTTEQMNAAIKVVDDKFANYSTTEQMNAAIKVEADRAKEEEGKLSGRLDTLEAAAHEVAAIDDADIRALFA